MRLLPLVLLAALLITPAGGLVAQELRWQLTAFPEEADFAFISSMIALNDGSMLATVNNSVYRTFDRGDSWETMPFDGLFLQRSPNKGLLLKTDSHFLSSADEGRTWSALSDKLDMASQDYVLSHSSAALFVSSAGSLFGSGQAGIFRSLDEGQSWTQVFDSLMTSNIVETQDGGILCAINRFQASIGGEKIDRAAAIFRSDDLGETWQELPLFDPLVNNWRLWTAPITGTVFASANLDDQFPGRVYRSSDNGLSWNTTNLLDFAWAFVELPDKRLFVTAINSGVHFSVDGGRLWSGVSNGLLDPRVFGLALHPSGVLMTSDFFARAYRTQSAVVSVSHQANATLRIGQPTPNPSPGAGSLPVHLNQPLDLRIEILNEIGQQVRSTALRLQSGSHSLRLPIAGLANGAYYCRITTGGSALTRLLLLQR